MNSGPHALVDEIALTRTEMVLLLNNAVLEVITAIANIEVADASVLLSAGEVRELTGKAFRGKQADWLVAQGIPFRQDGGRILVSRSTADAWLGRKNGEQESRRPDFSGNDW